MGKQAKLKAARRERGPDPHLPGPGDLVPGTLDPATNRASVPRRANWWRALPGRRVACDLCFRQCVLKPGEAGWCKVRRNDGGALRLTDHGVLGACLPHLADVSYWRSNSRMVWVAGVSCTSACSFCSSTSLALAPQRLPWAYGERGLGQDGGWSYARAVLHPAAVVAQAPRWHCSGVYFGIGEPTLNYEFTYDTARLAKVAGLFTFMDTNGYTAPAAIRALAPFMDGVYLGVKGSADPALYATRMRSAGAVPHVLAAAEAWRESPAHLGISDVIAPPHWVDDDAAAEAMRRFYTWIAETLGPTTPLELRGMVRPQREYGDGFLPLLPRDPDPFAVTRFMDRLHLAEEIARDCGLRYVYSHEHRALPCHRCGAPLVGGVGLEAFTLNVGEDGRCGSCGGQTPIVGISQDEYAELQAEAATVAA